MKRIDKAFENTERTLELMKLPGVKRYTGGIKITIMNNFCPIHYHMNVKGCEISPIGTKDCIKCWRKEEIGDDVVEDIRQS